MIYYLRQGAYLFTRLCLLPAYGKGKEVRISMKSYVLISFRRELLGQSQSIIRIFCLEFAPVVIRE